MNLPSSLRALNYKNFRLYVGGQSISLIGTWMQRIAVSWLIYTLTHSAFMLGLVAFAGQIPVLLLSPYAGAYVDRHSRYHTGYACLHRHRHKAVSYTHLRAHET